MIFSVGFNDAGAPIAQGPGFSVTFNPKSLKLSVSGSPQAGGEAPKYRLLSQQR